MVDSTIQTELREGLARYNGLDKISGDFLEKPYDGQMRVYAGEALGAEDSCSAWAPDTVHTELLGARNAEGLRLAGNIDDNLEEILGTETAGFDTNKTFGYLAYVAQNSMPVPRDPENITDFEKMHANIYHATQILESRSEDIYGAREEMKATLRAVHAQGQTGYSIDRVTRNQPQILEGLYASYVETEIQKFVSEFASKAKGKEGTFKMGEVKNFLKRTIKGSNPETKIKLANGLVQLNS